MPGMREPSLGWAPMICTAGFCSFKKRDTPVMVPVVPMALTKCVMRPPVCCHSSGPVVS
jgi:hypothetical protein